MLVGYEAELHSQAGALDDIEAFLSVVQSDRRPWVTLPAISKRSANFRRASARTTRSGSAKPAAWQPRSMPRRMPTTPLGLLRYPGDELMMSVDADRGIAIDLCAGSANAENTLKCYEKAGEGGLARFLATTLCGVREPKVSR